MAFRRPGNELRGGPRELATIGPALGAAIDRFRRDVEKAEAKRRAAPRRAVVRLSRMPSLHVRQPVVHRPIHPPHVRKGAAPTLLQRRRAEAHARGGAPALAVGIEAGASGIAAAIRSRLFALRRGLSRLGPRTGGR
jgi:hypothetical protein